jgi:methylenetetrahydrofolate reductase (NADPH)
MSNALPRADHDSAVRIAGLMQGFSLEATLPSKAEVDALAGLVDQETLVYLSSPPNHPPSRLIDAARLVRAAGLVPVPHITARAFANQASFDAFVAQLNDAGVTRALVIAGDLAQPAGPFPDALALIRAGVLERRGITEIGIAAYPDGHPKIADHVLAGVLTDKLDEAFMRGLTVHIVTQFCFDAEQILAWLRRIRYARVDVPVRIGIAGPATMRGLMRYALRCGVRASLKGLMNPRTTQLIGEVVPDVLVEALSDAKSLRNLEPLSVHVFSFGGLVHTARWARAAAAQAVGPGV